jgi:threonine/homoserine/homoserine lactone efflux protein
LLIYLTEGLLLGGTAAALPGPFQAYLLSQTLKNGWRRAIWATFAPLLSDGPIIALVLLVLSQMPGQLLNLLQISGGLFLFFLAWKAYAGRGISAQLEPTTNNHQSIFEAALMNTLSPSPYLFWATVAGPILIQGWHESPFLGVSFVVGFYGTLIGGFIGFVALFTAVKQINDKLNRLLGLISAAALFIFGLYQLGKGLTTWITA